MAEHIAAAIGVVTIVYWFARLLIPVIEANDAEKSCAVEENVRKKVDKAVSGCLSGVQ